MLAKLKTIGLPVLLGFIVTGVILALIRTRFGIEIGDPVALDDAPNANQTEKE